MILETFAKVQHNSKYAKYSSDDRIFPNTFIELTLFDLELNLFRKSLSCYFLLSVLFAHSG